MNKKIISILYDYYENGMQKKWNVFMYPTSCNYSGRYNWFIVLVYKLYTKIFIRIKYFGEIFKFTIFCPIQNYFIMIILLKWFYFQIFSLYFIYFFFVPCTVLAHILQLQFLFFSQTSWFLIPCIIWFYLILDFYFFIRLFIIIFIL